MRKFIINVNGNSYEVEVEEVGAGQSAPVAAAPVAAAPAPKASPAPKAAPAAAPAGSISVNAPMPGNINAIKVTVGQAVKKGDNLLILEAMKMENEIKAPQDGVVASIAVSKGQSVNTGDLLISLK